MLFLRIRPAQNVWNAALLSIRSTWSPIRRNSFPDKKSRLQVHYRERENYSQHLYSRRDSSPGSPRKTGHTVAGTAADSHRVSCPMSKLLYHGPMPDVKLILHIRRSFTSKQEGRLFGLSLPESFLVRNVPSL